MKRLLIAALWLLYPEISASDVRGLDLDPFPYISVGLMIGRTSENRTVAGPKLSLGISNARYFHNLTLGFRAFVFPKDQDPYKKWSFIEYQAGMFLPTTLLGGGGGIGVMLYERNSHRRICPMFTAFVGSGVFVIQDFYLLTKGNTLHNGGLQLALPIPLAECD